MQSAFWSLLGVATALKALLIPAYHSTDFEVHRNWLAVTHSLPLNRWYEDSTSEWTLDYPPFFAYFEWALSQIALYIDPQMLLLHNHNYASPCTKYFQRMSVIATDAVFALGVWRCLRTLEISKSSHQHFTGELLLLLNVGLIFIDHIHFQYNGLLYGIMLLSIAFLLEERYLLSAFTFAVLLNFKHIFLYIAPPYGVYLLKFYCINGNEHLMNCLLKLAGVGAIPFLCSFGPFWQQLPQVFHRLFPFKRGLTHAYWAPNFWAVYNTVDKGASALLGIQRNIGSSSTAGLVQEVKHTVLPTVTPTVTFVLTALFMLPILVKLFFFTARSQSKITFLRALVLCGCSSFLFGWHVHEKAILLCLIPFCLLCVVNRNDAKYAFLFSVVGYFSLFPLLFHIDLLLVRYSLYLAYIAAMYAQIEHIHKGCLKELHLLELMYLCGFVTIPLYEHLLSPLLGLKAKMPFMPLLLTSFYCSIGLLWYFFKFYMFALGIKTSVNRAQPTKFIVSKSKSKLKSNSKSKLK